MRDRRVVYDSEDEEEGFSPVSSPVKGNAPALALAHDDDEGRGAGRVEEPTSDSLSTDPELFKQIYEHQQRPQDTVAETIPDTAQPGQQGSSEKQKSSDPKAKDNSSSITDPTLKSAKKRTMSKVDAKDFANLTQVTTPSAPSAKQKDVYDFPLSDEEGAPAEPAFPKMRVKKADTAKGKRKREQLAGSKDATTIPNPSRLSNSTRGSSAGHAIQIEDDVSPRLARKKRSNAQPQDLRPAPSDVDLLVVPTTAEMDNPLAETYDDINDHQVSVVRDTLDMAPPSRELPPASLFVVPPARLSASQKQEYLQVSGYSELDGEDHPQPSLPPPKPLQTQGQAPPNTESTILYTTPSRYCPSAPLLPLVSSSRMAPSSAVRTQQDAAHPESSPDELTTHPVEPTSRSMKRKRDEPELNEPAQNDSWDSDRIGFPPEKYVPRPSRRRYRAVVEGDKDLDGPDQSMPDTCPPGDGALDCMENTDSILNPPGNHAPQDDMEGIAGVEGLDPEFLEAMPEDIRREILSNHMQQSSRNSQAPQTRSRGRPRGTLSKPQTVSDETPQPKKRGRKKKEDQIERSPFEVEEADGLSGTAPTATIKRRRGRPRKGEASQPPATTDADDVASVMDTADLVPSLPGADIDEAMPVELVQDTVEVPKAPSKRGRKKKATKKSAVILNKPDDMLGGKETPRDTSQTPELTSEHNADDTVERAGAGDEREALRDISNNASQNTSNTRDSTEKQGAEKQQEVTPEPKAKDIPRSASTTSRQGKVPFRVGLSKKSKITPLLKIIRK